MTNGELLDQWMTRRLVEDTTWAYWAVTPAEQERERFRIFLLTEHFLTQDMDDG